mmetsp:Transcript_18441/g.30023  ORF Transcript_18441/g.30023 Transcript_18441/m.30023 type:complete len:156 (-) Transcript_18441:49-516(-)
MLLSRGGGLFGQASRSLGFLVPEASGVLGLVRFSSKKAGGSTKNGRDSPGKRLGLKKNFDEFCKANNIIVRQRGSTWHAGENVGRGKDFTLYSKVDGRLYFTRKKHPKHGTWKKWVNILPLEVLPRDVSLKTPANLKQLLKKLEAPNWELVHVSK